MKFITFSGIDGSGKSTQLALLKEKLERENWNVAYFHAVEFSIASKLTNNLRLTTNNQAPQKAVMKASWFAIFLRKIFFFIDLIRFRFYFTRLKRENCDYLLSDRYFYDSIINIEYLQSVNSQQPTTDKRNAPSSMLSVIRYLLIVPDLAFYFDIAPEMILSRERVPEQGKEYLEKKQALFKEKAARWGMTVLDANRDKETIFQDILTKI